MRHQAMLIFLVTAFVAVCSVGPLSGRAQDRSVMTLVGKKDGAFKAQGGSGIEIGSLKDVSSIMNIKRSTMDAYLHSPRMPLLITRGMDRASPQLLDAHSRNEVIPQISFKLFKPGDNAKYKIVTLTDVTIADVKARGGAGGGTGKDNQGGQEELSLNYQKLSIAYYSGGKASATDDWN